MGYKDFQFSRVVLFINLFSCQKCMRVLVVLSLLYLVLSVLLIVAVGDVVMSFVALICISLRTTDVEYL